VTTKAVERTAEAIGGDIAQRQQQQIQRAVQLDLCRPLRGAWYSPLARGLPTWCRRPELESEQLVRALVDGLRYPEVGLISVKLTGKAPIRCCAGGGPGWRKFG
jgi:hypothetical protein